MHIKGGGITPLGHPPPPIIYDYKGGKGGKSDYHYKGGLPFSQDLNHPPRTQNLKPILMGRNGVIRPESDVFSPESGVLRSFFMCKQIKVLLLVVLKVLNPKLKTHIPGAIR